MSTLPLPNSLPEIPTDSEELKEFDFVDNFNKFLDIAGIVSPGIKAAQLYGNTLVPDEVSPFSYIDEQTEYRRQNVDPLYKVTKAEALTYAGEMGASDSLRGIAQFASKSFGADEYLDALKKKDDTLNAILNHPEWGTQGMVTFLSSAIVADPVTYIPIVGWISKGKKAKSLWDLGKYGMGSGAIVSSVGYTPEDRGIIFTDEDSSFLAKKFEQTGIGALAGGALGVGGGFVVDTIQKARGKGSIFAGPDEIDAKAFSDDIIDIGDLESSIYIGTRVRAKDKNNIGVVTDIDEKLRIATVQFVNKKSGKTATKRFILNDIKPDKPGQPKGQTLGKEVAENPTEIKFILDKSVKGNTKYITGHNDDVYTISKALDPETKKPLKNAWTITKTTRKRNPASDDPDTLSLPDITSSVNLGTFGRLKDAKDVVRSKIYKRPPPKNVKEVIKNIVDDQTNPANTPYKPSNPVLRFYQDKLGIPLKNLMFNNPAETIGGVVGYNVGASYDDPNATFAQKFTNRLIGTLSGAAGVKGGRIGINKGIQKYTGAETYEDVLGKTMGRLIISDYGLKPEYLATKQNFRTNKNEIGLIFHDIVDKASKELNEEQRKLLYYLMNGDQVELSKLSPEALAINAEVRTLIIKYGQELVDRGLLDEKIFRKNIDTYIKRTYNKPRTEKNNKFFETHREIRIIGDELKPRGLVETTTKKAFNRKNSRFKKEGGWEILEDLGKGKIKVRRQYTTAERKALEEVEDAAFAIAETGRLFANDIATARFFADLTKMDDLVMDEAAYKLLTPQQQKNFTLMPSTKIGGTTKLKYGELSGKYVDKDVLRDLRHTFGFDTTSKILEPSNPILRLFARGLDGLQTLWKKTKTAWSVPTHVGNFNSNIMLADFADMKGGISGVIKNLPSVMKMMKDKNSTLYRQAVIDGIFDVDMVSKELRNLDHIEQSFKIVGDANNVGEGLANAAKYRLKQFKGMTVDQMERLYQLEDQWFRMMIYMDRIKNKGMSRTEAALDARKWFVDYDINAPLIKALKRTTVPFISYTYRVIPLLAEAAALRPHKFAKWGALGYALDQAGQYITDDKIGTELDRITQREDLSRKMFGAVPVIGDLMPNTNLRMPVNDKNGNALYWDVARWLPGGDIFEQRATGAGFPGIPGNFQPGGVYYDFLITMATKTDPFTGRELEDMGIDESDTGAVFMHYLKNQVPNLPGLGYFDILPKSYGMKKYENAKRVDDGELDAEQVYGRQYVTKDTPHVALAFMFGIRLRPQDVEVNKQSRQAAYERELQDAFNQIEKIEKAFRDGTITSRKEADKRKAEWEKDIIKLNAEKEIYDYKILQLESKASRYELEKVERNKRNTKFEGGTISEDFPVTDVKENSSQRINPFTNKPYLDEQMNRLGLVLGGSANKRIERIPAGMDRERTTEEVIRGILDGVVPKTNLKTLEKEVMTKKEEDDYIRNLSKEKSFMENDATPEEREAVLDYIQKLNTDKVTKTVREAADKAIENLFDEEKFLANNKVYNNPGNIEAGQGFAGETGETYANDRDRPFVVMDSPIAGNRAILRIFKTKIDRYKDTEDPIGYAVAEYLGGNEGTLEDRIKKATGENPNVQGYIDSVRLGYNENGMEGLLRNVIKYESPNEDYVSYYLQDKYVNPAVALAELNFPAGTSTPEMLQSLEN